MSIISCYDKCVVKSKSKKRGKLKKLRQVRVHRKHVHLLTAVLAALAAVLALAWGLQTLTIGDAGKIGQLVTIYDRGEERVILTHAETVSQALSDADITVTKQDETEPSKNSRLLATDYVIIIYRSRPVLVVDGATKQKVVTAAASPQEIIKLAGLQKLGSRDSADFETGDFVDYGASTVLIVKRSIKKPAKVVFKPKPNALTKAKGAQIYVDSHGVAHRETYYDLNMGSVIGTCGKNNKYHVRAIDGAKVDQDGYVLIAANLFIYPRCSIVDTSMGLGKVYDTGGFAARFPHGFDLATDWSFPDGL